MRRPSRLGWQRSRPKPPPERGIQVKKSGTTWWGQRWIEALENVLQGDSARLARGRSYARAGRTHDLVIHGGRVRAKVTGSRPKPYQVTIQLTEFADSVWAQAIARMAEQAQFAAELLAGQMPKEIDAVFGAAKTSLFPAQRTELVTTCSCPDWGDPCKHVAATHYVLGEALDRDPFLLFELRGRTKAQVLDALRAARTGDAPTKQRRADVRAMSDAAPDVPRVTLGKLEPADYDRPRQPLPALHLSFDEPVTHGAVLRQLGAPTAWKNEYSPADLLAPLVHAAADLARKIALTEPDGVDQVDEPRPKAQRAKRGSKSAP
jgi:uncharacterized Zn finger protein